MAPKPKSYFSRSRGVHQGTLCPLFSLLHSEKTFLADGLLSKYQRYGAMSGQQVQLLQESYGAMEDLLFVSKDERFVE
ncbi:conserved hypothetical protein [Ricinus communis]|uniref:Uncharacterized protein n=1 Tax=Ricinus communis TaxID=3988 RepID=B9S5L5_RICCO|nr:conserved hypothetical protein [Ricinus communis]